MRLQMKWEKLQGPSFVFFLLTNLVEAVKHKPTFPDAFLNLGNVYKALGMPQEAIVCYQRALQT
jgi:Tfp pilus assembly protein PilF